MTWPAASKMLKKLTVRDIEVEGKRVLVRVDFNVPLDKKMRVIIEPTYEVASKWMANYVAKRIIESEATTEDIGRQKVILPLR